MSLFTNPERVHASLFEKPQTPVLVVGDLMLDRHLFGEVNRISPEAPVPVVRYLRDSLTPGGAGNVAMNLRGLGAQVVLAGIIGEDHAGEELKARLSREGIETYLLPLPHRPTITKTRIIGGHQQMLRLDVEEYAPLSPEEEGRFRELLAQAFRSSPGVVILSDYAKGTLTDGILRFLIAEGRRRNLPVLVDPKGIAYEKYRGATALSPNRQELVAATRVADPALPRLVEAGQRLIATLGLEFLLLTRSEEGMSLILPHSAIHIPAEAQEVFDVSGAGDTVIATLGFGLLSGLELLDAVRLANLAAGIVVGKVGTVPVTREELLSRLHRLERGGGTAHKIYTLPQLLLEVEAWRKNQERIVFTNGCFDLLHLGHVHYLEQAKELGDRLIVGVNSDASVRRLKGEDRPIYPEQDRLRILAALEAVDAVILFEEDTPLSLILALRPDVLVKGGDYAHQEIVGAQEVRGWGGEVRLIPFLEGRSTSGTLERVRNPGKP